MAGQDNQSLIPTKSSNGQDTRDSGGGPTQGPHCTRGRQVPEVKATALMSFVFVTGMCT